MTNELLNKYILGNAFDYLPKIKDKSVDLVFTSIPDFEELDNKDLNNYESFIEKTMNEICRIVKDNGFVVMAQTDRKMNGIIYTKHIEIINSAIDRGLKLKDYKILVKDNCEKINLYRLNYSHILIFSKDGKFDLMRKKEAGLFKDFILSKLPKNKNFWGEDFCQIIIKGLTNCNDLVVDPFAGRGTALKVAKELKRNFIGFEINADVYDKNYFMLNKLL